MATAGALITQHRSILRRSESQKKSSLELRYVKGFAKPYWRSRILRGEKWKAVAEIGDQHV